MRKKQLARGVLMVEAIGFGALIVMLWLDELLDLPHHLMQGPATPVNWKESALETFLTAALAAIVLLYTRRFLTRIKHLEGFIPVCAACKKIRHGDQWVSLEHYLLDHSEATLSHGLCPECLKQQMERDSIELE